MNILSFTTYNTVRAIIGVDSNELSDDVIGLPIYYNAVFLKLSDISGAVNGVSGSVFDLYSSISENDAPTSDEIRLKILIEQFVSYVVAEACCTGLSMFALKSDSDGKASQSRFSSDNTFRDVVADIRSRINSLLGMIEEVLDQTTSTTTTGIYAAAPLDRVTNE